jgi:hypothetical protein
MAGFLTVLETNFNRIKGELTELYKNTIELQTSELCRTDSPISKEAAQKFSIDETAKDLEIHASTLNEYLQMAENEDSENEDSENLKHSIEDEITILKLQYTELGRRKEFFSIAKMDMFRLEFQAVRRYCLEKKITCPEPPTFDKVLQTENFPGFNNIVNEEEKKRFKALQDTLNEEYRKSCQKDGGKKSKTKRRKTKRSKRKSKSKRRKTRRSK